MKKIKTLIYLIIFSSIFSISKPVQCQIINKDVADDMLVVSANTVIYGLIGGIGAKIHKKSFWEGFKNGAFGGVLIGAGKYMVGKDYRLGWPSKLTLNLGTSIVTNTARGKDKFQNLGMDLGPLYLEFQKKEEGYRFNPEIWLGGSVSLVLSLIKTESFDWKSSLATGTLTFIKNDVSLYGMTGVGTASSNIVWLPEIAKYGTTHSHEIIHAYQTISIAPLGALILGNGYITKTYDKWHMRIEEDFGSTFSWFPETMLIPNDKMPREYEADALVDYFPVRPHKRIWER